MVFQCINISQVPWEVLKNAAFGLGFQHLPWDFANVNAWKTMFDPYNKTLPMIRKTMKNKAASRLSLYAGRVTETEQITQIN